jgi:hypothetical protein
VSDDRQLLEQLEYVVGLHLAPLEILDNILNGTAWVHNLDSFTPHAPFVSTDADGANLLIALKLSEKVVTERNSRELISRTDI